MLADARSIARGETLRADVCVIGGGAAGLTVAGELARRGRSVVVLEGGGRTLHDRSQELYAGRVAGHPYYALDACRLRVLGGSTDQWGGWCRSLDATDFDARAWVPDSGWPFGKSSLQRFYETASAVCEIGAEESAPDGDGRPPHRGLMASDDPTFADTLLQIRPVRFGRRHGMPLGRSRHVRVLLHATALELLLDRPGGRVSLVRAATTPGNGFSVAAPVFVLAAGGIENARLLLCSRRHAACGIGNDYDLVGRYFADHLHVPLGLIDLQEPAAGFYQPHARGGRVVRGAISLSEEGRRRWRALGFAVTLHNADDPHDLLSLAQRHPGYASLQALAGLVRRRHRTHRPWRHIRNVAANLPDVCRLAYRRIATPRFRSALVGCRAEQAPNRDSRVVLDDRCDVFGVPRARLEWRISEQDLDSVGRAQQLLAAAFRGASIEMLPLRPNDRSALAQAMAGGAHHMGTTRMHHDPAHGVVDADCRVHSTPNLYVAGSSVFPTGGWAPPTLTIVALALRLADHLCHEGGAQA